MKPESMNQWINEARIKEWKMSWINEATSQESMKPESRSEICPESIKPGINETRVKDSMKPWLNHAMTREWFTDTLSEWFNDKVSEWFNDTLSEWLNDFWIWTMQCQCYPKWISGDGMETTMNEAIKEAC